MTPASLECNNSSDTGNLQEEQVDRHEEEEEERMNQLIKLHDFLTNVAKEYESVYAMPGDSITQESIKDAETRAWEETRYTEEQVLESLGKFYPKGIPHHMRGEEGSDTPLDPSLYTGCLNAHIYYQLAPWREFMKKSDLQTKILRAMSGVGTENEDAASGVESKNATTA